MPSDFETVFAILKAILAKQASKKLAVKADTPAEYTLVTKSPSPFPQHKGHPMYFGSVRLGKAYVSYHLMPLYMSAPKISPELNKRMQGKTCFNFKVVPDLKLLAELKALTASGVEQFAAKKWL